MSFEGKQQLYKWHRCEPGNMPEDVAPERIETTQTGMQNLRGILCAGKSEMSLDGYYYCVANRYRRNEKHAWTWAGGHPLFWCFIDSPC